MENQRGVGSKGRQSMTLGKILGPLFPERLGRCCWLNNPYLFLTYPNPILKCCKSRLIIIKVNSSMRWPDLSSALKAHYFKGFILLKVH